MGYIGTLIDCHSERSEESHEFLRFTQDRLQSSALGGLLQNDRQ
jgi:hypothetical protein